MGEERKKMKKLLKEDELASGIEHAAGFIGKLWKDYAKQVKIGGIGLVILIAVAFSYVNHRSTMNTDALKVFDGVQIYYRNGRYDDSLSEAKNLIEKYGSSKWAGYACYYSGNCYFNMAQYDEAIKSYEKAISKWLPVWIKGCAIQGMAKSYEAKGDYDKAVETYKKLLEKSAYEFLKPEAMLNMGKCYEIKQNFPEAVKCYQEIIAKYSAFSQAVKAREYNDAITGGTMNTNSPVGITGTVK